MSPSKKTTKAKSSADPSTAEDFDARLASLEALVAQLEDGGLGLETAIDKYQEGIGLLKSCHETLGAYKARIEELSEEAGVTLSAIEDPDADAFE